MMTDDIERGLRARVVRRTPIAGGEVCVATRLDLADGRCVFAKQHPASPPGFFAAEADGLEFLRVPNGPRVPAVVSATDDHLVLEWIPEGRRRDKGDFGTRLAALHRAGSGLVWGDSPQSTFLGILPLSGHGTKMCSWPSFWRTHRMLPIVDLARRQSRLSKSTQKRLEHHLDRLDDLLGHQPAPSRLHGDLWSGNRRVDVRGDSWIFDPSAQVGDREVDLAMMTLFGGFLQAELDAAVADAPLPSGWRDRRRAYQAFYLLVHVVLQGAHWGRQLDDTLSGLT